MRPTIGRIVLYRSRTGNYTVPAMITATKETLAPAGVEAWRESVEARERFEHADEEHRAARGGELPPLRGVPPLSSDMHVHLAVFTPGIPGMRVDAQDFVVESLLRQENVNGIYQEWDVPAVMVIVEQDGTDRVPNLSPFPSGDEISEPTSFRPGSWAWPRVTPTPTPGADFRELFIAHMREFAGELAGSDEARRVIYALDFMESRRAPPPMAGGEEPDAPAEDPVLRTARVDDIATALRQACAAQPEMRVGQVIANAVDRGDLGDIFHVSDEDLLRGLRDMAG